MKINGRLLLLAVVTGLFIRIWSGTDRSHTSPGPQQRRQQPVVAAREATLRSNIGAVERDHAIAQSAPGELNRPRTESSVTTLESKKQQIVEQAESWTESSAPIPLPAELSSGAWRVVDDTGRVARLEIDRDDVVAWDDAEFHTSRIQGRRWYFIRLNSTDRTVKVAPLAKPLALANRPDEQTNPIERLETEMTEWAQQERLYTSEMLAEIEAARLDVERAAESAAESIPSATQGEKEVVVGTPSATIETANEVSVAGPVLDADRKEESATPVESTVIEVAEVPDCVVKNRKFDFTGFGATAESNEGFVDADRPPPVDLPEVDRAGGESEVACP